MSGRAPSLERLSRRLPRLFGPPAIVAFFMIGAPEARGDDPRPCVPRPVDLRNAAPAPAGSGPLTVASLNMAAEEQATDVLAVWKQARSVGAADVLLLQEVRQSDGDREPS